MHALKMGRPAKFKDVINTGHAPTPLTPPHTHTHPSDGRKEHADVSQNTDKEREKEGETGRWVGIERQKERWVGKRERIKGESVRTEEEVHR